MGQGVREAERKVPGGKLVQMSIGDDGAVRLTGDFFLHPEEALAGLESFLSSLHGKDHAATAAAIKTYAERSGMMMIGVRPVDLAELLAEVRK